LSRKKGETAMAKKERPVCVLVGQDGNVFNVIGRVSATLKRAGLQKEAEEFQKQAFEQESYDAVLKLCSEYVSVQ